MAIITKMPGQAIINGFKGVLDYYVYMGLNCVRTWPKSPGHTRSPAVMAQWPVFIRSSQLWYELSPVVRQAYIDMAVSTNMTPRDIFTKSYISGSWQLYTIPDELEE